MYHKIRGPSYAASSQVEPWPSSIKREGLPHQLQLAGDFVQLFFQRWSQAETGERSCGNYGLSRIANESGGNTATFGLFLKPPQLVCAGALQDHFGHAVLQPESLHFPARFEKRRDGGVSHLRREFSSRQLERLVYNDNLFHVLVGGLFFGAVYIEPGIA